MSPALAETEADTNQEITPPGGQRLIRLPCAEPDVCTWTSERLALRGCKPRISRIPSSRHKQVERTHGANQASWLGKSPAAQSAGAREEFSGVDVRSANGAAASAPQEVHPGKASSRMPRELQAKAPKPIAPIHVRSSGGREESTGAVIVDTQVHDMVDHGEYHPGGSQFCDLAQPMCRGVPPSPDSRRRSPNSVGAASRPRSRSAATEPSDARGRRCLAVKASYDLQDKLPEVSNRSH